MSLARPSRWRPVVAGAVLLASGGLVPLAGSPATAAAAPAAPPASADLTAATFADPPTSVRPKYRWWVPLANTEDAELVSELTDMKKAGAGGAEVIGFSGAGTGSTSGQSFLEENGWGTPKWAQKLDTMIGAAADLDLGLDVTVGPKWPSVVPTVTDLNDPRAAQQLVYSSAYVAGGSTVARDLTTGLTPAPPAGAKLTLVAALLARCTNADCATQSAYTRLLERQSVIDVTDSVGSDNTLNYAVPGDSSQTWTVIAFYQTADGSNRANLTWPTPAYYLDQISEQGLAATTDFYDDNILPTIQDSIDRNGRVDFFEDSLELGSSQKWTWDFAQQWQTRRGYSPITSLPVLAGAGAQGVTARPMFDFSDGSGARIRTDYRQTWSDLYVDVRLKPLKAWANSHGMNLRVQPYGMPVDTPEAATAVDVPEGESLAFNHNIEDYKLQAVGAHLNGTSVVSNECCASRELVWDTRAGGTKEPGNLFAVYRSFAGGVTQVVWHGYPYLTQGNATASAPGTVWPGMTYSNNTSFAEAWGAKGGPNWQDYKGINDQIARLQLVLRQGKPRFDVAVYWQDFGMTGHGTTGVGEKKSLLSSTSALAQRGYTYDYLSPANLAREDATVDDGRLLADAGNYKALVLNRQKTMSVATAERIIGLADAGLPVVVVGGLPSATPGAADAAESDAALATLMSELSGKVTEVESLDDVPGALGGLGISPDAAHATNDADVVSVHRQTTDTDYYYLFNQSRSATKQTVTLRGSGRPYLLDTWSGEITPLTDYEATEGGIKVAVSLQGADTKVIALSTRTDDGFAAASQRSSAAAAPDAVPTTVPVDTWDLAVQSWTPGGTGLPGDTAKTDLGTVEVTADQRGALPAWKEINPEHGYSKDLTDVSGVGTYTTTVTLSDAWTGVREAWLDLGSVVDTVKLTVNGTELPPVNPQDIGHVEVGKYLRPGDNTIEARVSSTLLNAVRVAPNTGAAGRARAAYGLLGPVRLMPHDGDRPMLGLEALDPQLPLGDGGNNQARISVSNHSSEPTTVTVTPTTSDPAVRATADAPTVELGANETATVVVRLHGDRDSGTSELTVTASASNGTTGSVAVTLLHSSNLALNTVDSKFPRVFASSHQDRYAPEFLTDGDPSTFWVSGGQAAGQGPTAEDPEYVGVDLGVRTRVQAVSLWGRTDYGPRDYQVQTSTDGKTWQTVASVTNAPKYGKSVSFTPVQARYVRALVTTGYYTSSPGANTQAFEFAVYGAARNLALLATPSASSTNSKFNAAAVNDGWTYGQTDYAVWNAGNGWNDANKSVWPDLLTLTWPTPVQVSQARVLTVDNGTNPAATFGLRDYTVQALVGDDWQTVATVSGNKAATIDSSFDTVTTTALRLNITASNDAGYSRVVEFEAYCGAEDCPNADVTPPDVAISAQGATAGEWIGPDGKLAVSASDASGISEVEYRLDAGAWQDYSEPFGLTAGMHRVDFRATDEVGNRSTTQTERFGMDAQPPTTSATTERVPGNAGAIRVTLSATDAESGVAETWYAVDNGEPTRATEPFVVEDARQHVIEYWSVDAVGNAEDAVTLTVEKGALSALVTQVEDLAESDYTTGSWQGLLEPLASAHSVLDDADAIQGEVDAARRALQDAVATLVLRGDPTVLTALIDVADGLLAKADGFTTSSVQALTVALDAADTAYAERANRSQPELDAAVADLRAAIEALEFAAPATDFSVLTAVIRAAGSVTNPGGRYTRDSWSTFQTQLRAARKVAANSSATQAQIDAAVTSLTSALAALTPAESATTVSTVKLGQRQLRLVKGRSFALAAGVYYASGAQPRYDGALRWASSDPRVVRVSGEGVLRARRAGIVTIRATSKQLSAAGRHLSAKIRVRVVPKSARVQVRGVTASVPRSMGVGQVRFVTGTYKPARATGVRVTYRSANPAVVHVDTVGRLVARRAGTVKITVKAGNRTRSYQVTVR